MADRGVVLAIGAAATTWVGVLVARPVSGAVLIGAGAAWVAVRRRTGFRLAVAAILLLGFASEAGARSAEGLRPVAARTFDGVATLVGDPQRFGSSVRVDLEVDGRRVEAWSRGAAAARLAPRAAGEHVEVRGRLGPPPPDSPWLTVRHVVGRMSVDSVGEWRPGSLPARAANGVRRTLAEGAEVLGDRGRPLFLGLVLGDDRGQDPLLVDAFDGSGLTHLLAVSGSNVAMVMALVAPLLARLRLGSRLVVALGVLALFALVTRFEPSVLRATWMAGLGATAATLGWDAESRRILPSAVAVLLLVDPVLARSIGFQLSVAASAGIIWWSGRLALALPGPRWLATPLAVTLAAQLAVAPLLVPAFGPMPLASLPANLLAGPAATVVVTWGLPAGLVAGIAGAPLDGLLHVPTRAALWVVATVAEESSGRIGAEVDLAQLAVLAVAGLLAVVPLVVPARRLVVVGVVLAVVAQAALVGPPARRSTALGDGAVLHVDDGATVVLLDRGVRAPALLDGLRRAGVGRIDVVVALDGGREVAEVVALLARRSSPRLVLAPAGHRIPGGSIPPPGATVTVGSLAIEVRASEPRLEVAVRPASATGSAGGSGVGRTAAAPPRSRSSPRRRRTRRRSSRPGRSTTTRATGPRPR